MDNQKIQPKSFLIFLFLCYFLLFSSASAQSVNITASVIAECADSVDNDGDGLIDYPVDPGCASATDDNETDPVQAPAETPVIIVGPGGGYSSPDQKPVISPKILKIADFNSDGRINIIDFSILLFYMDKPMSIASRYDLNNDAKIDIVDVSILFYYWT